MLLLVVAPSVLLPVGGIAAEVASGRRADLGDLGNLSQASSESAASRIRARNAERAIRTYHAMQRHLFDPENELYRTRVGEPEVATVWGMGEATAATMMLRRLPGHGGRFGADVRARLRGLELFWDPGPGTAGYDAGVRAPLGAGGHKYYDDNEVIALELLRLYRVEGDPLALSRARGIFDLVASGWDDDPAHACPGGVFWTQWPGSEERGSAVTAMGAELALGLHEITGEPAYLEWGVRMYQWVDTCLRAPDGTYWNSIEPDGHVHTQLWSYNQGAMIGASLLLARATADPGYVARAQEIAAAASACCLENAASQPSIFQSMFFSHLLTLGAETGDPRYRRAVQAYADGRWRRDRDGATGMFHDGPGPPTLLDQAAMIKIYAMLACEACEQAG